MFYGDQKHCPRLLWNGHTSHHGAIRATARFRSTLGEGYPTEVRPTGHRQKLCASGILGLAAGSAELSRHHEWQGNTGKYPVMGGNAGSPGSRSSRPRCDSSRTKFSSNRKTHRWSRSGTRNRSGRCGKHNDFEISAAGILPRAGRTASIHRLAVQRLPRPHGSRTPKEKRQKLRGRQVLPCS
jgi:hypothetical protein